MPLLPYTPPYVQWAGVYFDFQSAFSTSATSFVSSIGNPTPAISTLSSITYLNTLGISSLSTNVSLNTLGISSLSTTTSLNTDATSSLSTTTSLNTGATSSLSTIASLNTGATSSLSTIASLNTGATSSLSTIASLNTGATSSLSTIASLNTGATSSLSTIASLNTLGISSLSTTTSLNTGGISTLSTTTSLNTGATSTLSTLVNFRPLYSIYVAPNGNDTTGTGSQQIPYSTIERALSLRTSTISTTVEVAVVIAPGTYSNASIVVPQNTYLVGAPSGEAAQAVNIYSQIALQANGGVAGLYGLNLFPAASQCVNINNAGTYNINACSFSNAGNYCLYQTLGTTYVTECRFTCPTSGTLTGIGGGLTSNTSLIMRDCVLTTTGPTTLVEFSGNLTLRQCSLTNTSALSTVSSLVVLNPTVNNTSSEISYCTLQYTSGTSALNKICVRANVASATVSTSILNCVNNLLICEGAQSGSPSPHCIDKVGPGPVNLSYGNLLAGATAYRIDGTITKTQYNIVA